MLKGSGMVSRLNNNHNPEITAIIGTFNRAGLLPTAINSVLAQTYENFELLVIDNGSTDNTRSVVESYTDKRVRYLFNDNPSSSCAAPRNLGIKNAQGKYVAFLDDDDIWYPDKLKICLQELSKHPDVALICHAQNIISDGEFIRTNICGPWSKDMHERLMYERNFLGPGSVLIKKEIISKVGGFKTRSDYSGCEDYDLWIRLAKEGYMFHFIELPLAEFRVTGFNESNDPFHPVRVAGMIKNHIQEFEGDEVVSARGKMRMASLYFYAARVLTRAGENKEASIYYRKILDCGLPGLRKILSDQFLKLMPKKAL